MAPPLPDPKIIRLTFAPEFFGSILAWFLYGFVVMQFYTYVTNRPNDTIWLKLLVYFVIFLVTINIGIDTASGYEALVGGWGNEIVIEKPPKPLIFGPTFKSLVALCVQDFYAWRIWVFMQRTLATSLFCGLMVALSIIQVGGGIGIAANFLNVDLQSSLGQLARIPTHLWLICGLVNDVLITAMMVVILRSARSNLITQRTKTLLGKLIRLTIQTGTATSVLVIAVLVLFLNVSKDGAFQALPGSLLDCSYALSLLSNLNINVSQTNETTQTSFYVQPSTIHFEPSSRRGAHSRKPNQTVQGTLELSLSTHVGTDLTDISHIAVGEGEDNSTSHGTTSKNHVDEHDHPTYSSA